MTSRRAPKQAIEDTRRAKVEAAKVLARSRALKRTPAWILDEWLACREIYHEILREDFADATAHIERCDEALADYDRAAVKLNKLFKR